MERKNISFEFKHYSLHSQQENPFSNQTRPVSARFQEQWNRLVVKAMQKKKKIDAEARKSEENIHLLKNT